MIFGLGTPARPKAVAFDIIGTTFPLETLRPRIVALGLPPAALEGWFAAGLRDAFALALTGEFAPFTKVLDVWSQRLMVQQPRASGRKRYGPGSARERHDDRGRPSSDTA